MQFLFPVFNSYVKPFLFIISLVNTLRSYLFQKKFPSTLCPFLATVLFLYHQCEHISQKHNLHLLLTHPDFLVTFPLKKIFNHVKIFIMFSKLVSHQIGQARLSCNNNQVKKSQQFRTTKVHILFMLYVLCRSSENLCSMQSLRDPD